MKHSRCILIVVACLGSISAVWCYSILFSTSPWLYESRAVITAPVSEAAALTELPTWRIVCSFGPPFDIFKSHMLLTRVANDLNLDAKWKLGRREVLHRLSQSIVKEQPEGGDISISVRDPNDARKITASLLYHYQKHRGNSAKRQWSQRDEDWARAMEDENEKVEERKKIVRMLEKMSHEHINGRKDTEDLRSAIEDLAGQEDILRSMKLNQSAEVADRVAQEIIPRVLIPPSSERWVGINCNHRSGIAALLGLLMSTALVGFSMRIYLGVSSKSY